MNMILPPLPQFRVFKLKLKNNSWVHVRKKIYNSKQLNDVINKQIIPVTDVFVSIGYFLNPQLIKSKCFKEHGSVSDNLFLGSDFLFEVDNKDKDNFVKGLKELKKIINSEFEICETGRGYQCRCIGLIDDLHNKVIHVSHFNRVSFYKNELKKIANKLAVSTQFDYNVAIDVWRICRVRGSLYKGKTLITSLKFVDGELNTLLSDEICQPNHRQAPMLDRREHTDLLRVGTVPSINRSNRSSVQTHITKDVEK